MKMRMLGSGEITEVSDGYAARLFEQGKAVAVYEECGAEEHEPKQRERAAEKKDETQPREKGGKRRCR